MTDLSECTIKSVYSMLTEIVKDHECPLCGHYIFYSTKFVNGHLPFVEDDGKAITAGIICGKRSGQRLVLLKCVKGSGEDVTVPF